MRVIGTGPIISNGKNMACCCCIVFAPARSELTDEDLGQTLWLPLQGCR